MVIIIISILIGAAVPSITAGIESSRTKGLLSQVASLIATAESDAVERGHTVRLVFTPENGRFWLAEEKLIENEPSSFQPIKASDSSVDLEADLKVADFHIGAREEDDKTNDPKEEQYVEFRRDGTTDTTFFVFENSSEEKYSIIVAGMTGRIRIVDFDYAEAKKKEDQEK